MARVERFSQSARKILLAAQEEAERLRNGAIEPPHIFLALLRVDNSVAARTLSDLRIDYDKVLAVVKGSTPSEPNPPENLDLAPETRRILESALQISRKRGDQDIGSEHLLLALVKGDDKSIRYLMRQINLEPQMVRNCVERVLQQGGDNLPPTRPFTVKGSFEEDTDAMSTAPQSSASAQDKVLHMIDTGKISAIEGAELLNAMRLSSIPIPDKSGYVLLALDGINYDLLQAHVLRFSVNGSDVIVPFEQAQNELLRLLRSIYNGDEHASANLGDLKISLE
jgi:hypothetical protein